MASYELTVPISEAEIRALHVGDSVRLSGVLVTARDAAHRYLVETLMPGQAAGSLAKKDLKVYEALLPILRGGVIYHCGPIVRETEDGWDFVAAGPTTSGRLEPYQPGVIAHFGLRGVVGKGGMGPQTGRAFREQGAVYLHAVGGAASLIAGRIEEVLAVHKLQAFGSPEAMWVVRVAGMPLVVTMDSHGRSLHSEVDEESAKALERLL
ncbi:MAG: fumarate hydrolyase [Anaerolineales bacterium]|nr:MAG: fumarate hydrolyase [Anaerolineales bacterium]